MGFRVQLVEERVDEAADEDIDVVIEQVWGTRYIDDPVLRRRRIVGGATTEWHHVTDAMFSTRAMLSSSATPRERIVYDAYGLARHHWHGDVDFDGDVDSADSTAVANAAAGSPGIGTANYKVECDLNRDGVVNLSDVLLVGGAKSALPSGWISDPTGADNSIGYDGYVFSAEVGHYCVRHRWYDEEMGRWLQRDPAGYTDGALVYAYVAVSPTRALDPFGLWWLEFDRTFPSPSRCPDAPLLSGDHSEFRAYPLSLRQDRIRSAVERVCNRLVPLIGQVNAALASLTTCEDNILGPELRELARRLARMLASCKDPTQVLRVRQRQFKDDTEAHTTPGPNIALRYHPDWSQRDSSGRCRGIPGDDWYNWSRETLEQTLFHELLHAAEFDLGVENADGTGTLYDPHVVDDLMSTDLSPYAPFQLKLERAKKECADCEVEGGEASDPEAGK